MKAAANNKLCLNSLAGAPRAAPVHAQHMARRRASLARSLRRQLAQDHAPAPAGKRIRSVEMLPLEAIDLAVASVPRVLLVDRDSATALILTTLLVPEAEVVHVPTLAAARQALRSEIFSAVVIDPSLPDGDAATLLPALVATPLLVYSAREPAWRNAPGAYLPKPFTSPRQLWSAISGMLGIATLTVAGD